MPLCLSIGNSLEEGCGFAAFLEGRIETGSGMNASRNERQTGVPNENPFDFAQGKLTRVVPVGTGMRSQYVSAPQTNGF
jgi:hypothetical protein